MKRAREVVELNHMPLCMLCVALQLWFQPWMLVCKISPTKLIHDESFSQLLLLARQYNTLHPSFKCQSFFPQFLFHDSIELLPKALFVVSPFCSSLFRVPRSLDPLSQGSTRSGRGTSWYPIFLFFSPVFSVVFSARDTDNGSPQPRLLTQPPNPLTRRRELGP